MLDKFGNSSIIDDSDPNGVEMIVRLGKTIEFNVNFAFLTNLELVSKGRLPKGRTQFRVAAERHLTYLWEELAKKSKMQNFEPFKSCKSFNEPILQYIFK